MSQTRLAQRSWLRPQAFPVTIMSVPTPQALDAHATKDDSDAILKHSLGATVTVAPAVAAPSANSAPSEVAPNQSETLGEYVKTDNTLRKALDSTEDALASSSLPVDNTSIVPEPTDSTHNPPPPPSAPEDLVPIRTRYQPEDDSGDDDDEEIDARLAELEVAVARLRALGAQMQEEISMGPSPLDLSPTAVCDTSGRFTLIRQRVSVPCVAVSKSAV